MEEGGPSYPYRFLLTRIASPLYNGDDAEPSMTVVQQLFDLLAIDVEIERFRKSIASIDDTFADNHLLLEAQLALDETQATLITQETERKDLELIVESFHDKGELLESKL